LEPLRRLVAWLERAGVERICLVDNASTYAPLLEWYDQSPHLVVRLEENLGHLAPWRSNVINTHALGEAYVVTDPDVVPDRACPLDALDHFGRLLDSFPDVVKVGFGLRIDNLPRRYRLRRAVQAWESQFWVNPVRPGVYRAPIDTTFALYREHTPAAMEPALRTGWPYVARHLPWYADSKHPTDEDSYYALHARQDVTSWQGESLPAWLASWLRGEDAAGQQVELRSTKLASRSREQVLARRGRRLSRRSHRHGP
jgi:hypothetical protein